MNNEIAKASPLSSESAITLPSEDITMGEAGRFRSKKAINLPSEDLTMGEAGPLSSERATTLPSEDVEMQEAVSSKANRVIVCLQILCHNLVIIKTNDIYLSFK